MTKAVAKQIFSGFTNPNQIDKSAVFSGCDFLLLNALNVGVDQYEIAASIVIEVVADTLYFNGQVEVPQAPLGTKELPLSLPFFDTALIVPLPSEATRSDCQCYICLATSFPINIEIFSVSTKNLCECKDELSSLQNDINFLKAINTAIAVNQIAQDVVLLATATVIGVGLALPTGGTSLSLPPAVTATLAPATASIVPILISAGVSIPIPLP